MADTKRADFFDSKNEAMLDRLLTADFQRRLGGELNEKQGVRLEKTIRHYMIEVYEKNPTKSVQYLNKEVLTSVVPDYLTYLRRSNGPSLEETAVPTAIRSDVSVRFGQLQNERQEAHQAQPVSPDFRISLDMEGATPLSRFEEIKRIREAEAAREAETSAAMAAARATGPSQELVVVQRDSSMGRFIESGDDFRSSNTVANERDQLTLIMREAERSLSGGKNEIVDLPDPRRILIGDNQSLPPNARSRGIASANPTTAIPERVRERPVLQQDVLRPQDDIISYKEIENNLFIYSADRDWVNNTSETRYNFSVTFDPANNSQSFGYNTATNIKFKNIVRIEFVKAIMPTEGIDILVTNTAAPATSAPSTDLNVNILSLPYLQVRIPELNVNGYGTNDGMNNAFAGISYDAYWTGDSGTKNRGFARMIPKFLKCQKVYYPTPLATLQKLSFQIQKPDGTLVSTTQDTLDINGIYMPVNGSTGTNYKSLATGPETWDFLWLQTSNYFSKFAVTQGDRIIIKNVTLNATLAANANAQNLINFLTRAEGHLVCDVGIVTGSTTYTDTPNKSGYTNGIIIRNSFNDPTTGSVTVQPWVSAIAAAVNSNPSLTKGRLINMNRQIQIIMRVITREMDSAAKLRPDNLQA